MYELFILSLLLHGPKHGYLIAKIINDGNGPFAKFSSGRLYPLLAKLQAEGLIAAEAGESEHHGERHQRTFTITEAGRQRFHTLMMDTTSNPGDYQRLFWFKLPFLKELHPSERLFLLDHYLNYCQTLIFHYTNEIDEFTRLAATNPAIGAEFGEGVLYVQQRCLAQWNLDFERARAWRAREAAHAETLPPASATTQTSPPTGPAEGGLSLPVRHLKTGAPHES